MQPFRKSAVGQDNRRREDRDGPYPGEVGGAAGLFSHSLGGLAVWHVLWSYDIKMIKARPIAARGVIPGAAAARLRQRRFTRLQGLAVPPDALPGSLALTYTRCGKPNCQIGRAHV